jgi:hypothetical protein
VPIGCGRPVWVDCSGFEFDEHFAVVHSPGPITEETVLAHAAEQLTTGCRGPSAVGGHRSATILSEAWWPTGAGGSGRGEALLGGTFGTTGRSAAVAI